MEIIVKEVSGKDETLRFFSNDELFLTSANKVSEASNNGSSDDEDTFLHYFSGCVSDLYVVLSLVGRKRGVHTGYVIYGEHDAMVIIKEQNVEDSSMADFLDFDCRSSCIWSADTEAFRCHTSFGDLLYPSVSNYELFYCIKEEDKII